MSFHSVVINLANITPNKIPRGENFSAVLERYLLASDNVISLNLDILEIYYPYLNCLNCCALLELVTDPKTELFPSS